LAQTVQLLQNLFSQILSKLDLVWLVHTGIRIIQSAFIAIVCNIIAKIPAISSGKWLVLTLTE